MIKINYERFPYREHLKEIFKKFASSDKACLKSDVQCDECPFRDMESGQPVYQCETVDDIIRESNIALMEFLLEEEMDRG